VDKTTKVSRGMCDVQLTYHIALIWIKENIWNEESRLSCFYSKTYCFGISWHVAKANMESFKKTKFAL